jgi:hypothetical protein
MKTQLYSDIFVNIFYQQLYIISTFLYKRAGKKLPRSTGDQRLQQASCCYIEIGDVERIENQTRNE